MEGSSGGLTNVGEAVRFRARRHWAAGCVCLAFVACTGQGTSSGSMSPQGRPSASPSPTGSEEPFEIAFTSRRHGYWSIYLVDEEGTQSKLLDITPVKLGPTRSWLDLLGQLDWSPNAPVVAFTCTPRRSEICIAVDSGSAIKRLSAESAYDAAYPEWTPDGRRIIFSSHRNGSSDIYSVKADGTDERPLVSGPNDEFGASVSADGKSLAYVEIREGRFSVHLARLRAGGTAEVFRTIQDASLPEWSPAGDKLVFTRHRNRRFADLYMTSSSENQLERLTRSPGLDYWAAWSPDSQMIAFNRDVDLDEKRKKYTSSDIHILDLDSGQIRNITNDDTLNMQPAWRP